ncbi:single-stranded-DNA-specific exonuclease RecJ [Sedimenticola hydrogenitrophicus]|uniref:single-stranded-DNA-specific exonuclease RecJ n=1 Tax=Sedimenticola hydrogenitrophicus TaxID=2967975 RepID=UPI0021A8DD53
MSVAERTILRPDIPAYEAGALSEWPLLQRIYALRGVSAPGELDYRLSAMLPPEALGGTREAAQLLHRVMVGQGRILVVADFDADGATSCALALRALRAMGAREVDFIVPNRFIDGYGLTLEIACKCLARSPDLVMTVDNGIASLDGVRLLREQGVAVLVTDHHLPGGELPDADVIVNPNNPGEPFPSKHLAGVGVVFYVMAALRTWLREAGWFGEKGLPEPNLADYLDLVALGTVADVVRLDHNNRILVQQGLARIRAGRCCELIRAVFASAGKTLSRVVATDLGFTLGPRLNAAGRLDDMSVGIAGLLSDSTAKAAETANLLNSLNGERKEIEQEMRQQALACLASLELGDRLPLGICVYQENWHQGVIGILASRIKEQYHRPVIAFADADDEMLKGSARSICGVHIRDILESIAIAHPQLLDKFGGHAMAAGLTLMKRDLENFSRCFDEAVRQQLNGRALDGALRSDGGLEVDEMILSVAQQLREAGPWGQGFPEPLFDDRFEIVRQQTVGVGHAKLALRRAGRAETFDAIAFNQSAALPTHQPATIHAAYRLDINEFRGAMNVQLLIEYFQVI